MLKVLTLQLRSKVNTNRYLLFWYVTAGCTRLGRVMCERVYIITFHFFTFHVYCYLLAFFCLYGFTFFRFCLAFCFVFALSLAACVCFFARRKR